jgi:transketolase
MNDLRKQFFKIMCELAKEDKDIILIVGDLGYPFSDEFARRFPKQFLNIGCIEQSMIGIACGMALAKKKPYVYSNAIFLLMRAYEQVRDDVCYNNLNVKLIGTGSSGFLGFTHNLGERENEKKLLEQLPNILYFFPQETNLKSLLLAPGPTYIKI